MAFWKRSKGGEDAPGEEGGAAEAAATPDAPMSAPPDPDEAPPPVVDPAAPPADAPEPAGVDAQPELAPVEPPPPGIEPTFPDPVAPVAVEPTPPDPVALDQAGAGAEPLEPSIVPLPIEPAVDPVERAADPADAAIPDPDAPASEPAFEQGPFPPVDPVEEPLPDPIGAPQEPIVGPSAETIDPDRTPPDLGAATGSAAAAGTAAAAAGVADPGFAGGASRTFEGDRAAGLHAPPHEAPPAPPPAADASPLGSTGFDQRPELWVGGAFVGGLLLARILKRLSRG